MYIICQKRLKTLLCKYAMYVIFPGGSDGKESSCVAGDRVQSLGQEDHLEKGIMATCSSILAGRIPCTEEPGRLQSMGSQRVGCG